MATTEKILKSYKSAMEDALSHIEGTRAGQTIIGGTKTALRPMSTQERPSII